MSSSIRIRDLVTGRHRPVGSSQSGAWTSGTPRFIRMRQAEGVDESVVPPAEQDSVVGVGRAAFGVVGDVMRFAPSRGHAAAGDDAAAVAEGERAPLVAVEEAFLGAETQDPTVRGEGDALDDPGAPDVTGDGWVRRVRRSPRSWPIRCRIARSSARPITMSVGAAPPIVGSSPLRAATPRASASASCSRCARVRSSRIDGEPRGLVVGLVARSAVSVESTKPTDGRRACRSRRRSAAAARRRRGADPRGSGSPRCGRARG